MSIPSTSEHPIQFRVSHPIWGIPSNLGHPLHLGAFHPSLLGASQSTPGHPIEPGSPRYTPRHQSIPSACQHPAALEHPTHLEAAPCPGTMPYSPGPACSPTAVPPYPVPVLPPLPAPKGVALRGEGCPSTRPGRGGRGCCVWEGREGDLWVQRGKNEGSGFPQKRGVGAGGAQAPGCDRGAESAAGRRTGLAGACVSPCPSSPRGR